MRKHLRFVVFLALGIGLCGLPAGAADKPPAGKTKLRVVVVVGGHGYDTKQFPKTFEGNDDIAFEIRDMKKKGAAGLFEDVTDWPYDVMVLFNFGQDPSEKERANFLKLMDRGVGLVILHHAIAGFPNWDEYEKILGAKYYLAPVEKDGVKYARSVWKEGVDIKVHVEDPNHPITKGVKDFTLHDETYTKWTYHPGNRLLLTTDNPLNNKQLAWVRTYRKSRVFFFQLGHGPGAFLDKSFQHVVAQGIRWCAGRLGEAPKAAASKENK